MGAPGALTGLDLFCCGGGAARGMLAAGVTEITGIDIEARNERNYPGRFIAHDLRGGLPDGVRAADFDIVWASPPCQLFSSARRTESKSGNLIPLARRLLDGHQRGVIENVPEAVRAAGLRRDFTLTGPMVGLDDILRERIFEFTGQERFYRLLPGDPVARRPAGGWKGPAWRAGGPVSILTSAPGIRAQQRRREHGLPLRLPLAECRAMMGIAPGEMTRRQVGEAVPPAYAKRVVEVLLAAWPPAGMEARHGTARSGICAPA